MNSPVIHVDGSRINDWDSFHEEFARLLGFPSFYGRNMDAWIDCLTYLDEDDGMRSVTVLPGQVLTLHIENYKAFMARCPELVTTLFECAAFVNWRRIEQGGTAVLALSISD